jgi:GntR family transcriptional regulator
MKGQEAARSKRASEVLDRRNGPLYQQFAAILRNQIAEGSLAVGDALPTEAEFAARYAISLITVRTGLRELEGEGLIRKRSAKRAVVAASRPLIRPSMDFHSFASIAESARDRQLRIRSYGEEIVPEAARMLGRPRNEPVFCLHALLLFARQPVSHNTIYFPHEVGARLQRSDFDDSVIFRSVQRKLGIRLSGAVVTLKADIADAAVAAEMKYPEGAPLLIAEMLYRTQEGVPIEWSIARSRADMFSVTYDAVNDIA